MEEHFHHCRNSSCLAFMLFTLKGTFVCAVFWHFSLRMRVMLASLQNANAPNTGPALVSFHTVTVSQSPGSSPQVQTQQCCSSMRSNLAIRTHCKEIQPCCHKHRLAFASTQTWAALSAFSHKKSHPPHHTSQLNKPFCPHKEMRFNPNTQLHSLPQEVCWKRIQAFSLKHVACTLAERWELG